MEDKVELEKVCVYTRIIILCIVTRLHDLYIASTSHEVYIFLHWKDTCLHDFVLQAFGKAATKARTMATRKMLTETEHAELLGIFKQATIGDGNVWKMFSKFNE